MDKKKFMDKKNGPPQAENFGDFAFGKSISPFRKSISPFRKSISSFRKCILENQKSQNFLPRFARWQHYMYFKAIMGGRSAPKIFVLYWKFYK